MISERKNLLIAKFMLRMPYSDVLNQINDKFRVNPIRHKVLKANKRNILKCPEFETKTS